MIRFELRSTGPAFVFALALLMTACGGGGGSGDDDDTPPTPDAPITPPGNTASATIGAAGGSLTLDDFTLTIAPGELAADTLITITRDDSVTFAAPTPIPDGTCAFQKRYDVTPKLTFANQGTTVTKAAPATAPADATLVLIVTGKQPRQIGTRSGANVTARLPETGGVFIGTVQIIGFSPPAGATNATIQVLGNPLGMTAVQFTPRAGGTATPVPLVQRAEVQTISVPAVPDGDYDVGMTRSPGKCGNVPGGFHVGAPLP